MKVTSSLSTGSDSEAVLPLQQPLRVVISSQRDACELFARTLAQLDVLQANITAACSTNAFLPGAFAGHLREYAEKARNYAATCDSLLSAVLLLPQHAAWSQSIHTSIESLVDQCVQELQPVAHRPVLAATMCDLDKVLCIYVGWY